MDYSFQFCDMVKNAGNLDDIVQNKLALKVRVKQVDEKTYKVIKQADIDAFFIPDLDSLYKEVPLNKNETDFMHPYFVFIRERYHASIQKTPFNFFRSFEQYAFAYLMKIRRSVYWNGHQWIEDKNWV